ncbi:unnamed protein product [Linum trigynum]|uniref:Uncharacterized protein n=1 Tax=Linum trigynum TaxID=586398 RepID=A0AAV2E6C1_9ROSI
MSSRWRQQEDDLPQGFEEEEQLVNVEIDQVGEISDNSIGAMVSVLEPNADPGEEVPSLCQIMEEIHQMVVGLYRIDQ